METLSSLVREHQYIKRLVTALNEYSFRVKCASSADPEDLRAFARAFAQFVDEVHHEKEERVLLPFLARHGFDWDAPPLSLVRTEHQHECALIEALTQAGERLMGWTDEERRHVSAVASALCEHQMKHHHTENERLFSEVVARLDAEAARQLQAELEAFDSVPRHSDRGAAARALGETLIARYSVAEQAER